MKAYEDVKEARISIADYFHFYNFERPHQALGYLTPWEVYRQKQIASEKIEYGLAKLIPHVVSMNIEMTPAKN